MTIERPGLERRILASLEASRTPVLLGACGSGRTSTLLRIADTLGAGRAQYLDMAACATTPEQCLAAVTGVPSSRPRPADAVSSTSPAGAFQAMLHFLDHATAAGGGPVTFLLDELLELRTFESFPGLRQVQREVIARLGNSPNRFVLSSRFTARAHRLLRDAPARFEVIHMPALESPEAHALAHSRNGHGPEWGHAIAPAIAALANGRVGYATALADGLTAAGPATPLVDVMASMMAPGGRIAALARFSYELRLHRARGYGALKAILGVLAHQEPLTLTEIAQRLRRTPGSTKDYLSWLEDVDLLIVHRKKYAFEDPVLRLFVRLYGRAVPPATDEIAREVAAYAATRSDDALTNPPVSNERRDATSDDASRPTDATRRSGIIEID